MYNLLIGPPGGGKSYEAVVYHVLPALEEGRKVITNLPLHVEAFAALDPTFPRLIELRTETRAPAQQEQDVPFFRRRASAVAWSKFVFGNLADYGDAWRCERTGRGPLYVIDECHEPLPRGQTVREVEEWFARHRHEGADVLLMTQSYGKVSKSVTDSAQVCYRVKKMTAFGKPDSYIRKVQDGVRGDVMSTAQRQYQARFFPLYQSHTKSTSAVVEADAKDISPAYKKWIRASIFMAALGITACLITAYKQITKPDPVEKARARTKEHASRTGSGLVPPAPVQPSDQPKTVWQLKPSRNWRLGGTIKVGGALSYVVYSQLQDLRIDPKYCETNEWGQIACKVADERVSWDTGDDPDTWISTVKDGPIEIPNS